jgi:hypothetical protein
MEKLKLVVSEIQPTTEQALIRMQKDIRLLLALPASEARAIYDVIEQSRDLLSRLLDRMEHV